MTTKFMLRYCDECKVNLSFLELDINGCCPKCHQEPMIRYPKAELPKNWPYDTHVIHIGESMGYTRWPGEPEISPELKRHLAKEFFKAGDHTVGKVGH